MSFAPQTILDARTEIKKYVPQLSWVELGIVGDDSHAASGSSYHLGKDALRSNSYTIIESSRDRNGLTNAASALDVGYFKITVPSTGKAWTLRDFSAFCVNECRAGAADTKDIREIIYSLDGKTVKRWDRLGIRSSGDDSHLSHTHFSWFRDSESRSKVSLFRRWFVSIGMIPGEDDMTKDELVAFLKTDEAKKLLASAVWKTDGVIPAPADSDVAKNPEWAGESYLYWDRQIIIGARQYAADALAVAQRTEVALAKVSQAVVQLATAVSGQQPAPADLALLTSAASEAVRTVLRNGVNGA